MGTINYKTGDYITLGIKPYDVNDMIEAIKSDPDEFDLDDEVLQDDDALYDYAYDYISQLYDDDRSNVEYILDDYVFSNFNVSLDSGYYAGFTVDISSDFYFIDEDDKKMAFEELNNLKKMMRELAGTGLVACYPGWGTGYADYNGTLKEIDKAVDKISAEIKATPIEEKIKLRGNVLKEASAYNAKLSQFLSDQSSEVQKFVKQALNNIFLGIKKDFGGYIEGKRPTISNYGNYKTLAMNIQANDDIKVGSNDEKGKWNFHYPIEDYCSGLGKILDKKFNGNTYQCVLFDHNTDVSDIYSRAEYEDKTSPAKYAMVGADETGIGGSYKNLSKDVAGNTYSIIVSVPVQSDEDYNNPFMSKTGNVYRFVNDTHEDEYGYSVEFDMSENEFVIRSSKPGSYDTHTIVYKKSPKALKAFKQLVKIFNSTTKESDVTKFLNDNGVKTQHSWWFNPYYD